MYKINWSAVIFGVIGILGIYFAYAWYKKYQDDQSYADQLLQSAGITKSPSLTSYLKSPFHKQPSDLPPSNDDSWLPHFKGPTQRNQTNAYVNIVDLRGAKSDDNTYDKPSQGSYINVVDLRGSRVVMDKNGNPLQSRPLQSQPQQPRQQPIQRPQQRSQ